MQLTSLIIFFKNVFHFVSDNFIHVKKDSILNLKNLVDLVDSDIISLFFAEICPDVHIFLNKEFLVTSNCKC